MFMKSNPKDNTTVSIAGFTKYEIQTTDCKYLKSIRSDCISPKLICYHILQYLFNMTVPYCRVISVNLLLM